MPRRVSMTALLAILLLTTGQSPAADDASLTPDQVKFFESRVRPVLVGQCYKCHAAAKQKGGLRLDSRAALIGGGDTGPALIPGKPEESLLVQALQHGEDAPKMPPSKKLPKEQLEALTEWVKIGAPWPGGDKTEAAAASPSTVRKGPLVITDKDRAHWAFQPIARPSNPPVKQSDWIKNPIDAFVLAGLEAKGLKPNPAATKNELIRRACYDLTGLPPTPEEVNAFLADTAPDAYEKLIDRLLASPRYGEKWGRHWLDLVRFAETNSYERDGLKPAAWRFRDYVIRSLNDDKPYDQFVREQLAGDEMPNRTTDSVIATGYYRLGIWDDEPSDREQAHFDSLDDIVATTGQVFLGMTVDCARCHDHKLDPIAQKDYYRLVSFFRNINPYHNGGPTDEMPLVEPGTEGEVAKRAKELEERREKVQLEIASIEEGFLKKRSAPDEKRPDIEELRYRFYRDSFDRLPNFNDLKPEESGELPRGLFSIEPRTRDDAFGFVYEGTLVVPKSGEYRFYLDSDDGSRLTIGGKTVVEYDGIHGEGSPQSATVPLEAGRVPVRLDYFQRGNGLGLTVQWSGPNFKKRALSTSDKEPKKVDLAAAMRKDGARVLGTEAYDHYKELRRQFFEMKKQQGTFASALCVTEAGANAPDTFVLARGNAHAPGDKVEPGFLSVLNAPAPAIPTPPPGAKTTGRRLVLADWITSPENPLTARVMANRLFQHHFGRGIARSPSNFGMQSDRPTHPELLDWLASELKAVGWKLKPLHRTIMLSNTYQMSSRSNPEALAKDPTNDLLWRFDMRRLTAEEIRDSILAVTGNLNLKMYGPGVFPEIPAEVLAGQSVPGAGWGKSPIEEQNRRSIYVHAKRSLVLPILEGFDLAETDRSSPVRFSTTQPTQALAMLNSTFLNDQAAALAERLKREAGDDVSKQVRLALRLTTGRDPAKLDVRRGLDMIEALKNRDGIEPEAARRAFCLVALNLNEFLYLD